MFKRDATWFGLLLGLALPAVVFGIFYLVSLSVDPISRYGRYFSTQSMALLSSAFNLILIRIYFVNFKKDHTGRGVLLATFLLIIGYFIYIRYS